MASVKLFSPKNEAQARVVLSEGAESTNMLEPDIQSPNDVYLVQIPSGQGLDKAASEGQRVAVKLMQASVRHFEFLSTASEEVTLAFLEAVFVRSIRIRWRIDSNVKEHLAELVTCTTSVLDARQKKHLESIVFSVATARWLVATPANFQSPLELAEAAKQSLRRYKTKIHGPEWLEQERCNLVMAVGQAGRTPCMVEAVYRPKKAVGSVLLVGKGVVFDAGGLDLKPPSRMLRMKYDMAGAAAVIGIARHLAQMDIPLEVTVLLPCVENMPAPGAMRPGDVYVSRAGHTVEITNTDAEGRLILADALDYGKSFKPDIVIDIATLTGAATTLAGWYPVAVSPNETLLFEFSKLAKRAGEKIVPLELWNEFGRELKSDVADLKNATNTTRAGTLAAGAFLGKFVDCENWLHLDIAASAWNEKGAGTDDEGPSGSGIRSVAAWLQHVASARGGKRVS